MGLATAASGAGQGAHRSTLAASTAAPPTTPAAPTTPVTGWLESEVTRMADKIRTAEYADRSREVYTDADWDESIRFLTNWAKVRSDIVRAQVAADRARRGIR